MAGLPRGFKFSTVVVSSVLATGIFGGAELTSAAQDFRVSPDHRPGSYTKLGGGTDATHEACSINRRQQSEPTVAVDPSRPRVIAAASMDTCHAVRVPVGVAQAQHWMGIYRSSDRGRHWKAHLTPGYPGAGGVLPSDQDCALQGDPTMAFDLDGRLFVAGLCFAAGYPTSVPLNEFHLGVGVLSNHGKHLERVVKVDRRTSPSDEYLVNPDKPNIAVDLTDGPHSGNVYIGWTECPKPGLPCLQGEYRMAVAHSSDHGKTFSPAVLVPDHPKAEDVKYADLAIGPDGTVFMAFRTGIDDEERRSFFITRSTDGGESFSRPVKVATVKTFDSARWSDNSLDVCGDGPFACEAPYTHGTFSDTPAVAADRHGVHVVFSGRTGKGRARLFVRHSRDGKRWDGPPRKVPAPHRRLGHQWHPDIASADGALSIVFIDSSRDRSYAPGIPPGNTPEGTNSGPAVHTWAASSRNGGRSWRLSRLSEVATNPNYETYLDARIPWLGDYHYASAVPGGAFGVWPDTRAVVPGIDTRAGNNDDGFDVHAPCDWRPDTVNPAPIPSPLPPSDAYLNPVSAANPCFSQGGLDTNVYGAALPHGVIDLKLVRRGRSGRMVRLRATTVRRGERRPVRGARVRLAGGQSKTGPRGYVALAIPRRALLVRASVRKPGLIADRIVIRSRRG